MTSVYVYAPDAESFADSGLCGDLQPEEAIFTEEKNGISLVNMTIRYDQYGKWKSVQPGCYIKAEVPVRVPPMIVDGDYATTVARYEPTSSRVNVYMSRSENSPVSAIVNVGQKIYGKSIVPILENFVQVQVKPFQTDSPDEKRVIGYFNRSSMRKIEDIAIVPASYGMEAITDLVTRLADQLFYVTDVTHKDNSIEVTAEHVFYELSGVYTSYKSAEGQEVSGSTVVNGILSSAYNADDRFEISSSCADTQTGIDYDRKSVVEALLDPKAGAMALFNMVILRDNYTIFCLPEADVGFDRGFVVEYGKNMVSIERKENIEGLATRVMPYGKDAKGDIHWMAGTRYVDAENAGDYQGHPMEILDTGLTVGKDGVTASNIDQKLREEALKEFSEGKVNLPEIQLKVSFLSLGDTEEYAQFRGLDKVYLYDKITVKDTYRGFEYTAEVVAVKHNILTGMLEEVTLGSIANSDGKRKIASWQVPTISGENIRLKSISVGLLDDGSVGTDALMNGAVTSMKIAALAVGTAQIDEAAITNAKISSAGIDYAKIKELNAESAFFGQSVFQEAVGEKLYVPRLLFDTAQGRQVMVKDLVVGASNGKYYRLDISENDDGISMTPTELTVSAAEIAAGHTNDGKPIIATTATVQDLTSENLYAIDALIDKITAKRIDVDELWARQAFINQLNVQDLTSNSYIHAALEGIDGDIADILLDVNGLSIDIGNIEDGTTPVGALDNTHVSVSQSGITMKTGGTFTVASGNFSIDNEGNAYFNGEIEADSGTIGGWSIGDDSLYAGSGTNHVELSTATGDYAFWAGAESATNAPFRVTKDGKVYSSKFIILNEQGGESVVDLRNYSLWKLGYATIKSWSVSGSSVSIVTTAGSINFDVAASVTLSGAWSGLTYTATASNGEHVSTTCTNVAQRGAPSYNPTTHNTTISVGFYTGDGADHSAPFVVSGASAFSAGVTAGESHFSLASLTLQGTEYTTTATYYTAGTKTTYYTGNQADYYLPTTTLYKAGTKATYYKGDGSSGYLRGDTISVNVASDIRTIGASDIGKQAAFYWTSRTYYKGNGGYINGRGNSVEVTPIGDEGTKQTVNTRGNSVEVTPIGTAVTRYSANPSSLPLYRGGTAVTNTYYTKNT